MIKTLKDYKEYLKEDKTRYPTPPRFASHILHTEKYYIWKQIKNLRRLELLMNNQRIFWLRPLYYLQMIKYYRMMHRTQIYIYPNVFGPGLYIPHLGRILTPPQAMENGHCIICQEDNVELSEGCKIMCRKIGNNVKVGPNAVVIMNIPDNTTAYAPPCEFIANNM